MDKKKRQDLPGGLWVLGTPIGNLGDLTERARNGLADAGAILCEDTRRTATLLSSLGIEGKSLYRVDAHTPPSRIDEWVEELSQGKSLALVTDAGTPGISDPGAALVQRAIQAGVRVVPVPGVSALTALLSVAGFGGDSFVFRGFFPRKKGSREDELKRAQGCAVARIFVWFESPERVQETLEVCAGAEPEAPVVVGKELTKLHEKIFHGSLARVALEVGREIEANGARGEWCFAIEFSAARHEAAAEASEAEIAWELALTCLLSAKVPASEAARQVSQHFGVRKKDAYEAALKLAGKKNRPGT